MPRDEVVAGSFRDPCGFLFVRDGCLLRQVNRCYQEHFDALLSTRLYEKLAGEGLLVAHEEVSLDHALTDAAYKVLKPARVPFISHPYEWCFSQLQDAALLTLAVQKQALAVGMTLKDASAYNVQFWDGRPVLIDSLSFEKNAEGQPWVAYRQFCQHFLAPLALMAHTDLRLGQLLRVHLDGIPLDLASKLLPAGTRLRWGLLTHLHLHARAQQRFADRGPVQPRGKMSRNALRGLIDSLESAVRKLACQSVPTEWGRYYEATNYSAEAFAQKQQIVAAFLAEVKPRNVWDLGANTGVFSRLASERGIPTLSFDLDPMAVEQNYREMRSRREKNLLPLVLDLTNPSPGLGWENQERASWLERGPADTVLALALVHHLAIGNNLPLERIAQMLAEMCRALVIEFVPKTDSQVQRMLSTRQDVFAGYGQENFEQAFARHFTVRKSVPISL